MRGSGRGCVPFESTIGGTEPMPHVVFGAVCSCVASSPTPPLPPSLLPPLQVIIAPWRPQLPDWQAFEQHPEWLARSAKWAHGSIWADR